MIQCAVGAVRLVSGDPSTGVCRRCVVIVHSGPRPDSWCDGARFGVAERRAGRRDRETAAQRCFEVGRALRVSLPGVAVKS